VLSSLAEKSAFDNADGGLTLLEHKIHNRLHLPSGADAHRRVDRDADQPECLSVILKGTRGDPAAAERRCVLFMKADHTPDGLRDPDVIHRAHKQNCLQTRNVDTLRENAVVKNNEFLVVVLTPGTQGIKEHLTIDFFTINHSTSLGSDIHPRVTTILQLRAEISLRNQRNDLLSCLGADQNLTNFLSVDSGNQVLTVNIGNDLTLAEHLKLLHHNLRRNDETTFHQFRGRHTADDLSVDRTIVHPRFGNSSRMLRSSSKEIAAVSSSSEVLRSREKVTLDRIVRFIEVNGIDLNICLLKTLQGVIGREDQFVAASLIDPVTDLIRASRALVMRFTTMNVQNCSVSDELKILRRELLCQQNARSNNYDQSLTVVIIKLMLGIKDTDVGFTTASRNNDLSFQVLGKGIQSTLLMGAKLDHW